MIVTFESVLPKTVPPTYSWDDGLPSSTSPNAIDLSIDSEGYYVGYAPFVMMRLSSTPIFETGDDSIYTIFRTVDFNDYYNNTYNSLTSLGFDEAFFCHVYVMPGTYNITTTYTEYTTAADSGNQQTILYQQESIEENQAPVFDLITENDRGRIYWNWSKLTCSNPEICDTGLGDLTITEIPWISAKCDQYYNKTWKEIKGGCFEAPPVLTPRDTVSVTPTNAPNKLRILEISPTAYLSAGQPDALDRISPLSATLTARFTKCGSFPIEKIVWDLGDGSPLLTQRRWSINNSYPFVYTGAVSTDVSDPRNYDINHVYTVTKTSGVTFYPSITAYAYSTGTTDCALTVVGPIKPEPYTHTENKITLLQNNLNDDKTFTALFQVNNDVVVSKFQKT